MIKIIKILLIGETFATGDEWPGLPAPFESLCYNKNKYKQELQYMEVKGNCTCLLES